MPRWAELSVAAVMAQRGLGVASVDQMTNVCSLCETAMTAPPGWQCDYSAGVCRGVSCLACVVVGCFSADVSRLTCLVASHAVLTWRAGGAGASYSLRSQNRPHPPQPPAIPSRLAALRVGSEVKRNTNPPHFGCRRTRVRTARVSRSDNLCSQCAEDGSCMAETQNSNAAQNRQTTNQQSLHRNVQKTPTSPLHGRRQSNASAAEKNNPVSARQLVLRAGVEVAGLVAFVQLRPAAPGAIDHAPASGAGRWQSRRPSG